MRSFAVTLFFIFAACRETHQPPREQIESPELNQEPGNGGRVGNGGGGIVCRSADGKIDSIEIYDFYEARDLNTFGSSPNFEVDFVPTSSSHLGAAVETAQYVVDSRIRSFDPALSEYLTWRLAQFSDEVAFSDHPLPPTNDAEGLRAPGHRCHYIQLAFTRSPDQLSSKRFHMRKAAFEHRAFSHSNRAALVLHELLYELTTLRGAVNSVGVRSMIGQIFSGQWAETFKDTQSYFSFARDAMMPWAGFGKYPVRLDKTFTFHDSMNLQEGVILPGEFANTPLGPLRVTCAVSFSEGGLAESFSFVVRPGEKYPVFSIDGYNESFTVRPELTSQSIKVGVQGWNSLFSNNFCDRQFLHPMVEVNEATDFKYFSTVDPPIVIKESHPFFTLDVNISTGVIIQDRIIGGSPTPLVASTVTFPTKASCNVNYLDAFNIELDDCNVKPFALYEKNLEVSSLSRYPKGISHPDNKTCDASMSGNQDCLSSLRFTLAGKDQWVAFNDTQENLLIKRGSAVVFDENGNIRKAVIIKSAGELCVSGSAGGFERIPQSEYGTPHEFDAKGCLIRENKQE